jgi:hypothetical protein
MFNIKVMTYIDKRLFSYIKKKSIQNNTSMSEIIRSAIYTIQGSDGCFYDDIEYYPSRIKTKEQKHV